MSLKIKLILGFILLCSLNSFSQILSFEEKAVFDDVAYVTQASGKKIIVKWASPIRYQIKGEQVDYLVKEAEAIFAQLKDLTSLDIKKAVNDEEANLIIEFNKSDPSKDLPIPNGGTMRYSGNFNHKTNEKSEIVNIQTLFVVAAAKPKFEVKGDLIRVILKSLGFFRKSEEMEYSLFYSRRNNIIKIEKSDSKIIKVFYAKEIKPGMTKDDVNRLMGL